MTEHAPDLLPLRRDDASADFFDATAQGQLLLKQCSSGHWNPPAAMTCESCSGPELSWAAASGRGTVASYAVIHRRDKSPLPVAIVALDEGPWLRVQLQGFADEQLVTGAPVQVAFAAPDGGETLPYFVPAT